AFPLGRLLSRSFAKERAGLVKARAWKEMPPAGDAGARRELLPLAGGSDALDTSYVAVVDAEGNGLSATPSDPNVDSPVVAGGGWVVLPRGSPGWPYPSPPTAWGPGNRPPR